MRIRFASLFAITALVSVVALSVATGAGAATGPKAAARGHARPIAAPAALSVLYNQNSNDSGVGIVSQDFTDPGFDVYDSNGADDFVVPTGHKWSVKAIIVTGIYFNGAGPADSETVTFYKDAGGLPGAVLGTPAVVHGSDSAGSFKILLPAAVKLRAGHYWVSVQATMAFSPGGEWAWETGNTLNNSAAAWQNPGDGFVTGCTSYANMQTCIGALGEGPDFMYALYGVSV